MFLNIRKLCAGLLCAFLLHLSVAALSAAGLLLPRAEMEPFLQDNCIRCHGPDKEKGHVRLDELSWDLSGKYTAELWADVLGVLEDGEMPPEDEPRPEAEALRNFIGTLGSHLEDTVPAADGESRTAKRGASLAVAAKLRASVAESAESPINAAEAEKIGSPIAGHPAVAVTLEQAQLEPFLQNNCIRCHGAEKQKGQVRFDDVSWQITSSDSAQRWQDVLDVLNGSEMPPEDEPQPAKEELIDVLNSLTDSLIVARKRLTDHGGQITMRRLNRREYSNTIADLFGFEISPEMLPEDGEGEPFDTIGKQQFFSSGHFEHYYELGKKNRRLGVQVVGPAAG